MATETDKAGKANGDLEELPKLDRENPPAGYEKTAPGGDQPEKSKKAKE